MSLSTGDLDLLRVAEVPDFGYELANRLYQAMVQPHTPLHS